jgi:hypothetical protein
MIDNSFFVGEYKSIPNLMRKLIIQYVNEGKLESSFLEAVSKNDLYGAFKYADAVNSRLIQVYAKIFNELNLRVLLHKKCIVEEFSEDQISKTMDWYDSLKTSEELTSKFITNKIKIKFEDGNDIKFVLD